MANMSKYLEQKILNEIKPGSFLALYRTSPGEDDSGTEVGITGYLRQELTFSEPVALGGQSTIRNIAVIEFPANDVGYGSVTHLGIRDAQYGGNLLFYKELDTPIDAPPGGYIRIEAGDLKVSLD